MEWNNSMKNVEIEETGMRTRTRHSTINIMSRIAVNDLLRIDCENSSETNLSDNSIYPHGHHI